MIFKRTYKYSNEIANHLNEYRDAYPYVSIDTSSIIPNEFIVYNIYNHKKYIGFIILYNDSEVNCEINAFELIVGIFKKYQKHRYFKNAVLKLITSKQNLMPPYILGAIINKENKRKPFIFNTLLNLGFKNTSSDYNSDYDLVFHSNL